MQYVTDTHALLWHLYEPNRVGVRARQLFSQADDGKSTICVPALVIAEMLMVAQKGRIPGVTVERVIPFLQAMRDSEGYWLCPLLPSTVLRSHTLTPIPDIFDRLIVAEALWRSCPLITRDSVIGTSGIVETIWD